MFVCFCVFLNGKQTWNLNMSYSEDNGWSGIVRDDMHNGYDGRIGEWWYDGVNIPLYKEVPSCSVYSISPIMIIKATLRNDVHFRRIFMFNVVR